MASARGSPDIWLDRERTSSSPTSTTLGARRWLTNSAGASCIPTSPIRPHRSPPWPRPWTRSAASIWLTSMPASLPGAAWATTSIPRPTAVPCPSTSTALPTGSQRPVRPSSTPVAERSWPPPPWPDWSPHRSIRSTARTSTPSSGWSGPSARATPRTASGCTRSVPSFAYTNIIKGSEQTLQDMGFPILDVSDVVAAFQRIIDSDSTGEAWYVVAGRESEPFQFRRAPGPRLD